MARNYVRGCAVLIVLALAPNVVRAQVREAAAVGNVENREEAPQQSSRIISLLTQLADQARASDDLAFAVRAQSQAATLLWPQDAEQARSIYRRAFESLATPPSAKPGDQRGNASGSSISGSRSELSAARKRQLRSELLNQIAGRDPDLAEVLAGSLTDKIESSTRDCKDGLSADCGSDLGNSSYASSGQATMLTGLTGQSGPTALTREDAERRELLMSAALQVVEREPQQAMAFAQMSVALGFSSNLARFLTLMRAVDAERADLLFSNAMARVEESTAVDLTEIHTLGSYVVSVVSAPSERTLSKQLVVRFLNLALNKISRDESDPSAITSRDESATYFIGRQLTDLVDRYLPDDAGQLQRRVSAGIEAGADAEALDTFLDPAQLGIPAPADIARDAIEATDKGERDSLWAKAALGWLARRELREAEDAALRISNEPTRDRVLVQITRRYSSEKRSEDALALARRVVDVSVRADVVVMLANAALASRDEMRAIELLNEAASCASKAPLVDGARSLLKIAGTFAAFDYVRSFETLQSAIKTVNETVKRQQDSKDEPASAIKTNGTRSFALDDLNAASLERTLTALATTDFDRALSLAQQLSAQEASIVAQLAVCKGGLAQRPPMARSTIGNQGDSIQNH
jgi:hypothetical protein